MNRKLAFFTFLLVTPFQLLFAQISAKHIIDHSESGETLFFTDVGKNQIQIDVNWASRDRELIFFIARDAHNDTLLFFITNPLSQLQPLYSYNKIHWFPINNGIFDGQSFQFQHKFLEENVYIALVPPPGYERPGIAITENSVSSPPYYNYNQVVNYVNAVAPHPLVEMVTLGQSIQGRDIFMLTVTDKSIPDSEKKSVWLQFRVHGDEMEQSYIFEGLVDYLLSDDSLSIAPQALEKIVFKLIPAINPDGIVNNTRRNVNDVDMNRIWVDSTNHETEEPEVRLVHDALDDWILNQGHKVHFAIDKHGWGSGHDGGYRTLASVAGNAYVADQSTFLGHMIHFDPWQRWQDWTFSTGAWGMARLALRRQHGLNILTWETTSGVRYEGSETTIESLKEEGVALVKAIYRYLFHVYFVNSEKNDIDSYTAADSVFIKLEEADAMYQFERNICSVTLISSLNDTETVALQEDLLDIGVFYSKSGLPLSATSPVPEDGILQVEPGKTIQVCYQDPDFADDFCSEKIIITYSSSIAQKDNFPKIETYTLFQNYPNPFNSNTNIQFYLPSNNSQFAMTNLKIMNILGENVKTLINKQQQSGYHSISWDGSDEFGNIVSNGVYFYRLEYGPHKTMKKLLFVK